jgi:hypothetical protein
MKSAGDAGRKSMLEKVKEATAHRTVASGKSSRGDRIRTCDIQLPKLAL